MALMRAECEGSPQWVIGATFDTADVLFGQTWVTARNLGLLDVAASSQSDGKLVLVDGGIIERRSADSKRGNIGVKLRGVFCDEISRWSHGQRVWSQDLRPTLSDYRGEAVWTTTPSGWDFVHGLYARIEAKREPDWGFISAPSWDNPYVFPGGRNDPEILAAKQEYEAAGVPELFRQEYGAEFTILSGVVFRKWDPRAMVVPHAEAARGIVQWYLGYDWGWQQTHPTVWALIGRTGGGQWRVVDEDYDTGESPEEILARAFVLLKRNSLNPQQIERIYYDPSRPEQGAMFRRANFAATKADYGLAERILGIGSAIGRPGGFLLSERCKRIAVELSIYRFRDDVGGSGQPQVVKLQDDGVDAVAGVLASVRQSDARGTVAAVGYAQQSGPLVAPHRRIR